MKLRTALAAALIATFLITASPGSNRVVGATGPTLGGCPVFPADHVWNTPIDTLPLDASSSTYVTTIGASKGLKADFGSGLWDGGPIGIPYVTVPGTQTKYAASFYYPEDSDPGPYAVPLNAPIEGGPDATGDRHAISVDTTSCILYELYDAHPQTNSWDAGSGAIFDLKSYALRTAGYTSADAAGLAMLPGLVRYDEVLAGEITHAIRFTVPQTRNTYIWPARHKASSLSGAQYPPMGQRFRLNASFDISGFSATNQVILRALKKYGMFVSDNGSSWYMSGVPDGRWNNDDLNKLKTVLGSNFQAVDESSLMIDPNSGKARQPGSSAVVSVSVSPASASVTTGATKQFSATVSGSTNTSVTWQVNGIAGGNASVGSVSAAGLYTAPATVPSPATVSVQAKSVADASAMGSASVTVTTPPAVKVTVSPTSATVRLRQTRQFSATVQNATNKAVVWKVNGVAGGNATVGTISSTGLYRAPNNLPSPSSVTVSATSVQSPTAVASATVQLRR